jgi:hypothetical protein
LYSLFSQLRFAASFLRFFFLECSEAAVDTEAEEAAGAEADLAAGAVLEDLAVVVPAGVGPAVAGSQ